MLSLSNYAIVLIISFLSFALPFAISAAQSVAVYPFLDVTLDEVGIGDDGSRISVGNNSVAGAYPWMTAVFLPNGLCGGVLVAQDAVLTSGIFYLSDSFSLLNVCLDPACACVHLI